MDSDFSLIGAGECIFVYCLDSFRNSNLFHTFASGKSIIRDFLYASGYFEVYNSTSIESMFA